MYYANSLSAHSGSNILTVIINLYNRFFLLFQIHIVLGTFFITLMISKSVKGKKDKT